MTEMPKKTGKKFKFFKFKGLGSLSNLPRSFSLRRSSASISIRSYLEPDTFEATQDDMVTVPKSPPAYARSSDMYSHMGTMPRPNIKKVRQQQAAQKAQEVSLQSHLVPQGLEAAKEAVERKDAPLEDTPGVGPTPSAVEVDPLRKPEEPRVDTKEEQIPGDVYPERATGELEAAGDYVKFSKEKYILDSSPEKLHKELEEELKLNSTDLRSHAWYHGRIPREVSETLVQRNGDFLIRDSLTSLGDYVLTCRWHNQALHFKINKVVVKAGESYTHIQYLFEQESFDHVPALVRYHVGSRKAVSEQSGAIIYCPVNRTFPLRYLEASYGLSQASSKAASPVSPSGSKGSHMKRRSITMTDGLTTDKVTRSDGCPNSTSLPHPRDSIRNCALSMDQIPDLHSPLSPISESPSSPAYSTVTRVHAAPTTPSTTAPPASPVARRPSEPQSSHGSTPKPPVESDKPHASPSHTLCKASRSPSLNSYSDPDSGHYCQLQPSVRGSREWAAGETPRKTRSSGERQKELSENGVSDGEWGKPFAVPVVEATSSFNLATFQSQLIPKENRPLEVGLLRKVKELLSEVDARTLARHVTKVDCLISRLEQTWVTLRQRHTEGAILYEKKLKPFLKGLNEGKESLPLSNTTFPHVLPFITLLECDSAPTEGPEPWGSTEHGVEVVLAHLEAARTVAHHGGLYHTNAEAKLQGEVGRVTLDTFAMGLSALIPGVARILGVTKEMQTLMGVRWGMELLTLPHGRQLRLDLLERFHTMSIMLAVDILGCTGSAEERAALLHKTIQLAAELRGTMGNMFSFAAVMGALEMAQVLRGFQARPELLEVFSTEFQMRLLWGSQGANSSQARRYEKFDKVLTALSHKLEPAIRSSEL
ncbi:SH2 domain containing 3C [Cricetulus griseus]